MIPVTKTFFPPLEEYIKHLERIWDNQWITNRGQLVKELESRIKEELDLNNVILTTNGTLPLQIALKNLAQGGEVITTPFSYVATTSAIVWENCTPVFVDIHPEYLTIDETKIKAAITEKTTAILATHVYGNPCNVEEIERIATKNNLKVIYDAAHCFGVTYKGKSIFTYGDISTCSFHATKLFHTAEGGAIFCADEELNKKLFYSHNFGHAGPENFHGLGINAKMSELQAAMGLTNISHLSEIIKARKQVVAYYDKYLCFQNVQKVKIRDKCSWNYSYYPIIFESEERLKKIQKRLNQEDIYPRRYFYPSLNTLEYAKGLKAPISESISSRIMCLPLFHDIKLEELNKIINLINSQ